MGMDDIKLFVKTEKVFEVLTQTKICSQDVRMEFGIEKCAMLIMKSGKRQITEGIELLSQKSIRTLREKETYEY